MAIRRSASGVAIFLALAVAGVAAVQQVPPPPYLPPPPETSVYELLDLGPAPETSCACVPHPFALPSYRPGYGYGTGPATPVELPRLSDDDRKRNFEWYANERRMMQAVVEDGVAGNPHASLSVAMHLTVHGLVAGANDRVEEDTVRWLTLAAQQGHPDAFRLLGYRYAHGRGVQKDDAGAAYWFDQGARIDDPISMTAIGFLLAAGRGVVQNWPAAIRWWQRAETRAPLAARYLGDAYACGVGVAEDRARALAIYKRFAKLDPSTSIQIGHMHVRGCAPPDDKAAVDAFRRAADQGYPDAQIELSELLREGRGADASPHEAYYWARIAEERLEPGDLKKRAAQAAATAARRMSGDEAAKTDELVKEMIAVSARPLR